MRNHSQVCSVKTETTKLIYKKRYLKLEMLNHCITHSLQFLLAHWTDLNEIWKICLFELIGTHSKRNFPSHLQDFAHLAFIGKIV